MIKREVGVFLIVGTLTVLVDFLCYRGLVFFGGVGVDFAKAAGFIGGTVFAYFANRLWTFGHTRHARGSLGRFVLLYMATLLVNVLANALALAVLPGGVTAVRLAFLIATGISATLNFFGMKFFVFNTRGPLEHS